MNLPWTLLFKIIKQIRGGHDALTDRKFKDFLKKLNSEFKFKYVYGDLLLYLDVRWLSNSMHTIYFFLFFYFPSVLFSKIKLNENHNSKWFKQLQDGFIGYSTDIQLFPFFLLIVKYFFFFYCQ